MSDTEYGAALKLGKKQYQDAVAKGEYPYLPVLDDVLENVASRRYWGFSNLSQVCNFSKIPDRFTGCSRRTSFFPY